MRTDIRLIVGLGNPGSEYCGTRHNVGFAVVERLLAQFKSGVEESTVCKSRCFETRFRGKGLVLQMPETFMNLSGEAVAPLMRRRKFQSRELLLIHDDMDLEPGRLRIRRGGSAGGHHGVESVIAELGAADFLRLRVGVGHGGRSGADHVLSGFEGEERERFDRVLDRAAEAVLAILGSGERAAMDKYNAPEEAREEQEKQVSQQQ